jgi:hypothetical protein
MGKELKSKILQLIEENHVRSGGHCGLSSVKLCEVLQVDYPELKESLNELYEEKLFKVRDGANGLLLFKT